jgi:PII-like signaling protein
VLELGPAKKVTIHLNEDTASRRDYLGHEVLSLLLQQGVSGASVLRPEAGFGSHHRLHTLEGGSDTAQHMPLRIEFVETEPRFRALLPFLQELVTDGMIEVQDTVVVKISPGTSQ